MVRILYYDACLVQRNCLEIDKYFDLTEIRSKLERLLWLLDKSCSNFTCGVKDIPSALDNDKISEYYLVFDSVDDDFIHDISIMFALVLRYSA